MIIFSIHKFDLSKATSNTILILTRIWVILQHLSYHTFFYQRANSPLWNFVSSLVRDCLLPPIWRVAKKIGQEGMAKKYPKSAIVNIIWQIFFPINEWLVEICEGMVNKILYTRNLPNLLVIVDGLWFFVREKIVRWIFLSNCFFNILKLQ